ncbi:uncharacterized protein [Notamacropus eugenii]|uniref:uncharacterized protein isoform X2 n=1 Tax=Notamacropus eugenii TaxID=9315 RepID=UPI003B682587
MLYLQIEAQRARAKRLQKEKELKCPEIRNVPEKKRSSKSAGSSVEIWDNGIPEEKPGSPVSSSTLPDSEWVKLSPQEKLSWAKSTEDPRIAIGHHSPLEKKIVADLYGFCDVIRDNVGMKRKRGTQRKKEWASG